MVVLEGSTGFYQCTFKAGYDPPTCWVCLRLLGAVVILVRAFGRVGFTGLGLGCSHGVEAFFSGSGFSVEGSAVTDPRFELRMCLGGLRLEVRGSGCCFAFGTCGCRLT